MEAIIQVEHAGCYTSDLTRRLGVAITVLSGHQTAEGSVGLWELSGEEAVLPSAVQELRAHPNIVRCDVVRRAPGAWILETVDTEAEVSSALIGAGLVFLPPVHIREGTETYRVFALERRQVDRAVRALSKKNRVVVHALRERVLAAGSPLASLTPRQREALELAWREGWYDRPRRVDQARLARKLKVSRPSLTERLARAEANVMRALFEA
ncbi:MAG TPA: helix-turn-helix domain-containing protein [Candidatus Thermoplasmatota archaeon]|nr:helix-turn-helix domain-containing protein [Candidatus Thermoplasmatota archaeon]